MRAQVDRPDDRDRPGGHRRRRRPPSRRRRLVAAMAGLAALALAVPNLGPALRAARADGTPGTFTAEDLRCVQHPGHEACTWDGTFRPTGGGPAVATSLYGGRHGLEEGDTTPAVDVGRASRVYPPTGSREWIATALLLLAGLALLVPAARSALSWLWSRSSLPPISRRMARDRRQDPQT